MKAKRLIYFLSPGDEAELSSELMKAFPDLQFIDDSRWETERPPICPSINACKSRYVYLWNTAIFPELPVGRAPDGRFQGPGTYHVIQFGRNILRDSFMQSAQLSMSIEESEPNQKFFCEKVYRIVKKQHSNSMRCIELQSGKIIREGINNLVLGKHAAALAQNGLKFVIGFGSNEVFEIEHG